MITINKLPGQRILELGCGDNPHPMSDVRCDVRPGKYIHFTADFNEPLPIKDQDFDAVLSIFSLEHLSWRSTKQHVAEMLRILKGGGKAIIVTANTEAQIRYIQTHPDGWDGRDAFDSASCILFGDNDYPENTHRNYMSPAVAMKMFADAGFENIQIRPYGAIDTDMSIEATRPLKMEKAPETINQSIAKVERESNVIDQLLHKTRQEAMDKSIMPAAIIVPAKAKEPTREEIFDRQYFNGGKMGGGFSPFYMDYSAHELTARHILMRKPRSVLELGCARGYVLKRIQDAGFPGYGLEISKHCIMTRVCNGIEKWDVCETPWPVAGKIDLCYSVAFWEHIPEDMIPKVIAEMASRCERGVHGIGLYQGDDKTKMTVKPKEWWVAQMPPGHEVVNKDELEAGQFPPEVLQGDGKLKLNIGCAMTMFHHGWTNIDTNDLNQFAAQGGFKFSQHDIRTGLPQATESVDLVFCHHVLEHLPYDNGLKFINDLRRVIKPNGALRFAVPNAGLLNSIYANEKWRLSDYDELNDACAKAKTAVQKLWAMTHEGHQSMYDGEALVQFLEMAGFIASVGGFRQEVTDYTSVGFRQMSKETTEMPYGLPGYESSLFVNAIPKTV